MLRWWERINREAVLDEVAELKRDGGCLVLQGDTDGGRTQAASLAVESLSVDFQAVRISAPPGRSWTERRVLATVWDALQPPATGFRLSAAAQLAELSPERAIEVFATKLKVSSPRPKALIVDDVGRDAARDYNLRPILAAIAKDAKRPVVVTYDPTREQWPLRHGVRVLDLKDFDVTEVRACLQNAAPLQGKTVVSLEEAVQLVFPGSPLSEHSTVRPQVAYQRLGAWSRGSL